jgi:hypothetical protein
MKCFGTVVDGLFGAPVTRSLGNGDKQGKLEQHRLCVVWHSNPGQPGPVATARRSPGIPSSLHVLWLCSRICEWKYDSYYTETSNKGLSAGGCAQGSHCRQRGTHALCVIFRPLCRHAGSTHHNVSTQILLSVSPDTVHLAVVGQVHVIDKVTTHFKLEPASVSCQFEVGCLSPPKAKLRACHVQEFHRTFAWHHRMCFLGQRIYSCTGPCPAALALVRFRPRDSCYKFIISQTV